MDITSTLAPDSDQLDAVDLAGGPRIFTIERVTTGNSEQPINVHLAEFPRPWRPGKSMRRVLAACWGTDASTWAGKRVELFCDPNVSFGKEKVGGTRIRALSGIDKPKGVPLLVSRGKSATFTVQPLPDVPPPPDYLAQVAAAGSKDDCNAIWQAAGSAGHLTEDLKAAIIARVGQLESASEVTE